MPPDDQHQSPPSAPHHAAAPPGWPRTEGPLNIAILGWARLAAQALEGSGYNLSKSELARGLAMSGHHISYLASGMTYRLYGGPRIAHREQWGGVECFDLINSPNLSPSAHNFRNTRTEIACPEQSALVLRWLDQRRIEVVHIHSLEGYGLDLVGAIAASGRPVVVTMHNYSYICPQVDLLHKEQQVCEDYDGGNRCVGCLPAPAPEKLKRKRAFGQTLERWLGPYRADVVRKAIYGFKPLARDTLRGRLLTPFAPPKPNPDHLADPELAWGFSTSAPNNPLHAAPTNNGHPRPNSVLSPPPSALLPDGLIRHDLPLLPSEHPKPYHPAPADQNERLLAAKNHLKVLNDYGRRRAAGAEALNKAAIVIPPSDFLRKVHVAMGVDEAKTRWVRLGQPHFDQINRRARRSPFYDVSPWDAKNPTRPVRFAFFGTTRPNKGLEVLARAIPLLSPAVRQRCQFTVHALGADWAFRKRLSLYPEVTVRPGYDLYQLIGSSGEYDVGLLPHIWLENSPLVMLEHLHAGKFVISSRLGGPVDWIDPSKNGLLFAAGHADELAERIRQVATGEVPLPSPREIHESTVLRSYPDHVREVESIYREVLGDPARHAGDEEAREGGRRTLGSPDLSPSSSPLPAPAPSGRGLG